MKLSVIVLFAKSSLGHHCSDNGLKPEQVLGAEAVVAGDAVVDDESGAGEPGTAWDPLDW